MHLGSSSGERTSKSQTKKGQRKNSKTSKNRTSYCSKTRGPNWVDNLTTNGFQRSGISNSMRTWVIGAPTCSRCMAWVTLSRTSKTSIHPVIGMSTQIAISTGIGGVEMALSFQHYRRRNLSVTCCSLLPRISLILIFRRISMVRSSWGQVNHWRDRKPPNLVLSRMKAISCSNH